MKLVFADSPSIDGLNLFRLILLSSELTFVERPSIQFFENFGTVATQCNVESVLPHFQGSPLKLQIGIPPGTVYASDFYKEYFYKDLQNPHFIDTVIDGIENGKFFDSYLDQKQNKAEGVYKDFKAWIIFNREKLKNVDYSTVKIPKTVFQITNEEEAIFTFCIILSEKSLRVTSVLDVAERYGGNPLSLNPFLNKLITLRLNNKIYSGKISQSRSLGIHLFQTLIPDEALYKLTLADLILFRERTKEFYNAWEIEVNKLESELLQQGINITNRDIQYIIDQRINPGILKYQQEIVKVRDDMFAQAMKFVKNFSFSLITLGTLSSISIETAIASFIALNIKTPKIADDLIDLYFKKKEVNSTNSLTYLMEVNKLLRL